MLPVSEASQLETRDYLNLVKKHRRLIAIPIPFMLVLLIFYHATCAKIYSSTTTIVIEKQTPKFMKRSVLNPEIRDKGYFETQYDILKSRSLAEAIVKKMDRMRYPEFAGVNGAHKFLSALTVEPIKGTNLVRLHAKSTDPSKAAEMANIWADVYINQNVQNGKSAAESTLKFLNNQIVEIAEKLKIAQKDLNNFRERNIAVAGMDKDMPATLKNLNEQKIGLEREMLIASRVYGENHPNYVFLKEQLNLLGKNIEEEEKKFISNEMAEYNVLNGRVQSYNQAYKDSADFMRELEVVKNFGISNIKVIDPASVSSRPVYPRPLIEDFFIYLIVVLVVGVGLCVAVEFMDTTFRIAEEVVRFAKIPFLGAVSKLNANVDMERRNLIAHVSQNGWEAEKYDAIATAILFASPEDKPPRSILIGSAAEKEGRSFVASNLAITFANLNERVVLVDMDLRKPEMHTTYKMDQAPGLADYLMGNANLDQVLKPTFVQNLTLLPAGTALKNPIGILALEKVHSLISELQQKFDRVVINSAPYLKFIDTSFLAHLVDGVVIVIRAESTRFEDVMKTKEKILSTKGKIIGAVLNNIPPDKKDIFYYYNHFTLSQILPKIKPKKEAEKK